MKAQKDLLSEEARVFGTHPRLKELVRKQIVLPLTRPRCSKPTLPAVEPGRFACEVANRITLGTIRKMLASS